MPKYSALGLTGIAGEGLKENSPIARALEGAYIKVEKETGRTISRDVMLMGLLSSQVSPGNFQTFRSVTGRWYIV